MPSQSDMRLTKIDKSLRDDHPEVREEDNCYFLLEYTAQKGYNFSKTNSIISNLKKKPSDRDKSGYCHKGRCIHCVAELFRKTLNPKWLEQATLVPIPGSKAIGDPDYDNRIGQICNLIGPNLDVRRLVKQKESTPASHTAEPGRRINTEELLSILYIDEDEAIPEPHDIGIFDDVITKGTHFRAVQMKLSERFPDARITGTFIARTIHPDPFQDF